jgi:hypothetical protein
MSLPSSGQITISGIRTELENTGTVNNFRLGNAGSGSNEYVPINRNSTNKPNLVSPHAMSEWYGYNHTQNGLCSVSTNYVTPSLSSNYVYYRINVTGNTGGISSITISSTSLLPAEEIYFRIYTTYPFTNTGSLTGSALYTTTITTPTTISYNYTASSSSDILYIVINNNYA